MSVARFTVLPPAFDHDHGWRMVVARVFVMTLLITAAAANHHPALRVLALAALALVSPIYLWPRVVEVGADGVLLRWMWTRRFIRGRDIANASAYDEASGLDPTNRSGRQGVTIALRDGRELTVPMGQWTWRVRGSETTRMAKRIRETMGHRAAETPTLLARGKQSPAEWMRGLRAIGSGAAATLRTPDIDHEQLWRVLESSEAEPGDRAAAAIALSASEGRGNRERIRVAAGSIAQPRLRLVVEAASEDDQAALEEALGHLDEEKR